MGIIWEIVRNNQKSKQFADLLLEFDKVLGLDLANSQKYLDQQAKIDVPEDVLKLLEERKQARQNKNWELSDNLRDKIKELGYAVKDTKDGMTVEKIW